MIQASIKSLANEDICILVKFDNHTGTYICECGDASQLSIKDCQDAKAILISHTHIDHFVNFDFLLRHQLGTAKKIVICGPLGITQQVQHKILAYTWNLIEKESVTYEVREIVGPSSFVVAQLCPPKWEIVEKEKVTTNIVLSNKKFAVQFGILDHKTPSICYKFQEHDSIKIDLKDSTFKPGPWIRALKTAFEKKLPQEEITIEGQLFEAQELFHLLKIKEGKTLGIIMDHAASTDNHCIIQDLFLNCQQCFIEAYYKHEDRAFAEVNHHSFSTASGQVMRAAQVKEAIPVHFSRKYREEDIAQIREEFEAAFKHTPNEGN